MNTPLCEMTGIDLFLLAWSFMCGIWFVKAIAETWVYRTRHSRWPWQK